MKTMLFIITAIACLAGDPQSGTLKITDADRLFLVAAPTPESTVTITARHDIYWADTNTGKPLLSVNGITRMVPVDNQGFLSYTKQVAPEKPEEITIALWTKDGKKWVAKWVEVEEKK